MCARLYGRDGAFAMCRATRISCASLCQRAVPRPTLALTIPFNTTAGITFGRALTIHTFHLYKGKLRHCFALGSSRGATRAMRASWRVVRLVGRLILREFGWGFRRVGLHLVPSPVASE